MATFFFKIISLFFPQSKKKTGHTSNRVATPPYVPTSANTQQFALHIVLHDVIRKAIDAQKLLAAGELTLISFNPCQYVFMFFHSFNSLLECFVSKE